MGKVEDFCQKYLVERKNTNSVKWDSLEERYGDADLTPLWVADMEFKTPDAVIQSLTKRVEHGVFGYTQVPDSYYDAYFAWQKKRYDVELKKDWIYFSTGVVSSFYSMVNAYAEMNEAVIILTPVYYPFFNAVKDTDHKLITSELVNENGIYRIDFADFEKQIVENQVKVYIHCSPHNPVGRVWTEEELIRLFDICLKHDVVIVADEIHQDLTRKETKYTASLKLSEKYRSHLVVLNSPSKTFNLACLLHSHIVIPDVNMRKQYDAYVKKVSPKETSLMGMVAAEAAYRHGEAWLDDLLDVIESNYQLMVKKFQEKAPKIVISPKEGTYLLWLDLRAYIDPKETKKFIQDECGLAIDFGEWFGEEAKGFIRINLATDPNFIEAAGNRMIEILTKNYM